LELPRHTGAGKIHGEEKLFGKKDEPWRRYRNRRQRSNRSLDRRQEQNKTGTTAEASATAAKMESRARKARRKMARPPPFKSTPRKLNTQTGADPLLKNENKVESKTSEKRRHSAETKSKKQGSDPSQNQNQRGGKQQHT
jgi:hypothetical protein